MKKIVALVLCLALALSLCTVALADTKTSTIDAKGYELISKEDTTAKWGEGVKLEDTMDDFTKTVTDKKVVTEGDKTTTTYYADVYYFADDVYYACDASIATAKLAKDGKVVAFLTDNTIAAETDEVVSKKVAKVDDDDLTCGDYVNENGDPVAVFVIDGDAFIVDAEGTNPALYNGKMVLYGDKAKTVAHFGEDGTEVKKEYNAKGDVVKVVCKVDNKAFTVVKPDADVLDDYVGEINTTVLATEGLYVLMGSVTTGTAADGTTVESAKTFDAGIALYAGMALASVAGSAVVIGKKKEF